MVEQPLTGTRLKPVDDRHLSLYIFFDAVASFYPILVTIRFLISFRKHASLVRPLGLHIAGNSSLRNHVIVDGSMSNFPCNPLALLTGSRILYNSCPCQHAFRDVNVSPHSI